MDQKQSRKIEALYEAALGVEPARRAAFLTENCADDESLRREVESLLLHDESAGSFLEVPVLGRLPEIGHRGSSRPSSASASSARQGPSRH